MRSSGFGPVLLARLHDMRAAFSLLTRLPAGASRELSYTANSAWAWPIVGAAVGAIGGAVATLLALAGVGPSVAALLAIACMIATTGAMHEDGLADAADGLFGGSTSEECLNIMRDSRIGAFGAIAICVFLIGRYACLDDLFEAGQLFGPLIAGGALSRAGMFLAIHCAPPARPDGMAASLGSPALKALAVGSGLAIALALLAVGWHALVAAGAAAAVGAGLLRIAVKRVGGVTGDVLGSIQQVCELACLVVLAALS